MEQARAEFAAAFGGEPSALACAPGRVELLGNHTDYNGGLVIAAAVDRTTVVVGRAVNGRTATIRAVNFGATDEFNVDQIDRTPAGSWTRYVRGVCWAISAWRGPLRCGFEAAIVGDIPLGAGLSSSASLQASVARLLIQLGIVPGLSHESFTGNESDALLMQLARALRKSENEFVGVGSGLLDQFSSLFGRAGHALFLDCATLAHERLPLGETPPAIIVCDSSTSRKLADGMYDERRAECERVVSVFRQAQGATSDDFLLSQVTLAELDGAWDQLDPIGRLRARHVLTENERVRQGVRALKSNDIAAFGQLMSESHVSSRDDFANSSNALDALIEAAQASPGFLGGKLSGAGWAGCTVNLVQPDLADEFSESVRRLYADKTGTVPEIHICRSAQGALGADLRDVRI
jgi:galactokinase